MLTYPVGLIESCSCSVTFAVWWLILVPVLMLSLPAGKARQSFHEWNTSYFLLTVHGFNLPFAVMDHLLVPRKLKYYDLWLGLAIAVSYLAFYLRFLDRYGIQLYVSVPIRTSALFLFLRFFQSRLFFRHAQPSHLWL